MFYLLSIGQIHVLLKVLSNAAISYNTSFLRECGIMTFRKVFRAVALPERAGVTRVCHYRQLAVGDVKHPAMCEMVVHNKTTPRIQTAPPLRNADTVSGA